MTDAIKKLMVIGAHPDDAEFHAAGLMCLWRDCGHALKILSLTDGGAGHQCLERQALIERRHQEAAQAAALLGAELEIWSEPDGELEAGVSQRLALIRTIRRYQPDVIVTHRSNDYHPDHRAAGMLVQDAAYLLQVPNVAPEAPPLARLPAILLMADEFDDPRPFRPDYIVDTSSYLSRITELLDCHVSQVYEWLPHIMNVDVPATNRKAWLERWYRARPARIAARFAGTGVEYAEAFEVSAYGRSFNAAELDLQEAT